MTKADTASGGGAGRGAGGEGLGVAERTQDEEASGEEHEQEAAEDRLEEAMRLAADEAPELPCLEYGTTGTAEARDRLKLQVDAYWQTSFRAAMRRACRSALFTTWCRADGEAGQAGDEAIERLSYMLTINESKLGLTD